MSDERISDIPIPNECKNCIFSAFKQFQTRWIPVTERLPEKSGEYLVTYRPCYWDDVESEILVGIDTFRGKTTWANRKYQRVTAWMPLPEPFRKETEDAEIH